MYIEKLSYEFPSDVAAADPSDQCCTNVLDVSVNDNRLFKTIVLPLTAADVKTRGGKSKILTQVTVRLYGNYFTQVVTQILSLIVKI